MKRFLDIIISLIVIVLLSPLFIIISVLVKCSSNGPIIFRQERLGKDGKPFTIYKFRSMIVGSAKENDFIKTGDERVILVGRVLRAYHLDEFPQFWNVIRGDMSLVGPRPERKYRIEEVCRTTPRFRDMLSIRPGITGIIQIHGRQKLMEGGDRRRYLLTRYYMQKQSFLLDVKILLSTLKVLFKHQGM